MMELMVLISETASALPCLAARAGPRMLVTLGVSFTITGSREFSLHQRVTISTYSGTWPTAAPMPRSDIPCGQPKLSSMPSAPVSSTSGRMVFHALFLARHHQRDDQRAVRPAALDLADLLQVHAAAAGQ